jgi:hypothetical protein
MNPNPATNESDAPLDRLLQAHLASPADQLVPSSGFALSVMDTIHQQAAAPPPIAFPWRRVLPGVIAILCALAALVLFVPRGATAPVFTPGPRAWQLLAWPSLTYGELVLSSVLLAACVSIVAVAASFRLAGRNQ